MLPSKQKGKRFIFSFSHTISLNGQCLFFKLSNLLREKAGTFIGLRIMGGFPGGAAVKNLFADTGDAGFDP